MLMRCNTYKYIYFSSCGCWLLPENFSIFARKVMSLPESGAAAPSLLAHIAYVYVTMNVVKNNTTFDYVHIGVHLHSVTQ